MFDRLKSYFEYEDVDLSSKHKERIRKLEGIIGTDIDNPFIYIRALSHRSALEDAGIAPEGSYERLEFLGDAVLDLVVTEIIFELFPAKREGFLTKLRAQLVKGDALAMYTRKLNLNELLLLGRRAKGQGLEQSKSVLADIFEALVGALYVDVGYERTTEFVRKVIDQFVDFDRIISTLDNYKSILLEYAQAHQMEIPTYRVTDEYGPGHDKTFEVEVLVDQIPRARGTGKSKKEAEQNAARKALEQFDALD